MKKLVFGLIATVMFGLVGNAQTSRESLEKTYGSLEVQKIDESLVGKSLGDYKDLLIPIYVEEQQGWCIIVGNDSGIVNVYTSKGLKLPGDINKVLLRKRVYHNCDDKPSDAGVLLCAIGTIVESVSCWFRGC